jgi:hypothetical protein
MVADCGRRLRKAFDVVSGSLVEEVVTAHIVD